MPSDELSRSFLHDGPRDAPAIVVLAHGAGAPMDHPFLQTVAGGVGAAGWHVVRFEFPYMQRRRDTGKRSPPDRAPVLEARWCDVIAALREEHGETPLVIGGKSLGGRMASHVADANRVTGLVCLGYPFHPPGKPERLRTKHLAELRTPTLVLQGERDTFGNRSEVATYELADAIRVHWLIDGDHSLKPRRASGRSEAENLSEAVDELAAFVAGVAPAR